MLVYKDSVPKLNLYTLFFIRQSYIEMKINNQYRIYSLSLNPLQHLVQYVKTCKIVHPLKVSVCHLSSVFGNCSEAVVSFQVPQLDECVPAGGD